MASKLGVQAIAGIAAGGFAVLVTVGICLVMIITRARDRRHRARLNGGSGRRHSRHSGRLVSIADEDVMRMPGTRAAIRHSLQLQSTRSPYTPMSSRDTIGARHTPRSVSRTIVSHRADPEPSQTWPLPRRLQRSRAGSIGKIQTISASPIADRYIKTVVKPPEKNDLREAMDHPGRNGIRPAADKEKTPETVAGATASPRVDLTPKPLFHGQKHSISQGLIVQSAKPDKIAMPYAIESGQPISRPLDQSSLQKGASVYDDACIVPTDHVLPLAFPPPARATQKIKGLAHSNPEHLSGGTILSDYTSILDDYASKAFSRTETDRTSIGIRSTDNTKVAKECLNEQSSSRQPWDLTGYEGRQSPSGAIKPLTFRPPVTSQKSFRVSVHDSLPRSKSSGLSINMSLQGPSTTASSIDLSKETFATARTRLPIQKVTDMGQPRGESSPSSRRDYSDTFNIHEDANGSQPCLVPLQSISGNGSSLASSQMKFRPSSVASSPQRWEMLASRHKRTSSVFNSRGSFHKKRDSLSSSDARIHLPLVPRMAFQEGMEDARANPSPDTVIRKQPNQESKFRPPSIPTFNPQIAAPAPGDIHFSKGIPSTPPAPMANDTDEDDASDLEAYTPTRRPSKRHPNRLKTIFDTSGVISWPLPDTPDPLKLKIVEQQKQEPGVKQRSIFSINFPSFPDPPTNQPQDYDLANWRSPRTPVRGPRPAPSSFQHSPTRRSPSRRVSKARGTSPNKNSNPSKALRKNVLALENAAALRRQNSEANSEAFTRGSTEHKRYLSIGSRESNVFEDLARPVESVEGKSAAHVTEGAKEKQVVKGPRRAMFGKFPKSAKSALQGKGSTKCNKGDDVGMYDEDGFLRE